ncbi:MAG: hypothetical protein CMK59_04700 [Proteobacteria bacterium]|nr:hypothetical protein [Pseudomonadota bacterium]
MKSWFKNSWFYLGALIAVVSVQKSWAEQDGDIDLEQWDACLDEVELSCAIDAKTKLLKNNSFSDLNKDELGLVAKTLFHQGSYLELEQVLDVLEYPESDPEDGTPFRSTVRASKGLLNYESDEQSIEIRHGRGVESVLAEEAMMTLAAAQTEYERIFGGIPQHNLVLDIFPTAARFIDASGLPPEAVRTTGVIALSKWNRLLLTSPRAMSSGYDWKDTIAHEYVHLVVAWRTGDKAPVWLQEGLAKFFEASWKTDGRPGSRPKGGYLTSYQQSLLAEALTTEAFVPFEKFKYSMAYLESSEEAALAFAQVSSMIDFMYLRSGEAGISELMDRVKQGQDPMLVVAQLTGMSSFEEFEADWKVYIRSLPLVQEQLAGQPVALDGAGGDFASDPLLSKRKDLARYARIGDLLLDKNRPKAALVEYSKAKEGAQSSEEPEPPSPHLISQEANCHFKLGNLEKAMEIVSSGLSLYPEYPPLYIGRAEILEAQGRYDQSIGDWREAHDIDPYQIKVEKALARGYEKQGDSVLSDRHERYVEVLESGGAVQIEGSAPLWPTSE